MTFQKFIKHYAAIAIALSLLVACNSSKPAEQMKQYQLTGKVVSIDKPNLSVVVNGDEIKGFMAAMAMPYKVKEVGQLDLLAPGDTISADLFVRGSEYWIDNVKVTQKSTNPEKTSSELKIPVPGQQVPDFQLVNQSGRKISLNQYRGKALIVTFIYTQCPFPDYCPRVTQQFAEINRKLLSDSALSGKTHLLSISFDPKHDTPNVLRDYGYKATAEKLPSAFSHWEFAVAPNQLADLEKFFGLAVSQENGAITHSLSTTVIAPDGKIFKWYPGNEWTPFQILQDAAAAVNSAS